MFQENGSYIKASLDLDDLSIIDIAALQSDDPHKKKSEQSVPGKPSFVLY